MGRKREINHCRDFQWMHKSRSVFLSHTSVPPLRGLYCWQRSTDKQINYKNCKTITLLCSSVRSTNRKHKLNTMLAYDGSSNSLDIIKAKKCNFRIKDWLTYFFLYLPWLNICTVSLFHVEEAGKISKIKIENREFCCFLH